VRIEIQIGAQVGGFRIVSPLGEIAEPTVLEQERSQLLALDSEVAIGPVTTAVKKTVCRG